MAIELPSRFVRTTRWAYLQDGIEVGPYDANEIVQLLQAREIAPDTSLVELNSRRTSLVSEVGPFARIIVDIVHETRRLKADDDFAASTREVASGNRRQVILISMLVLIAIGVGGTALFMYNPFASKDAPEPHPQSDPGKEKEATESQPVAQPEKEPEPAFKITEMDPSEMEQDPAAEMIESVLEERQLNPNAGNLADDQKLESVVKIKRPKTVHTNGAAATIEEPDDGVESGGGIRNMDFSEEEIAMGDGPSGPDDALAVARLRKVMRKCVEHSLARFPAGEEVLIDAKARLQPDGRLTGLKIDLMPRKAVGEIKMCISAELMRMRVPAFEGNEVEISTAVAVPAR